MPFSNYFLRLSIRQTLLQKGHLDLDFGHCRFCQADPALKSITARLNGINSSLICRELTVVIIRFVVLYLSEYSHVTYVNEQNPRSRVKFASAYKEVEMYMQCVC